MRAMTKMVCLLMASSALGAPVFAQTAPAEAVPSPATPLQQAGQEAAPAAAQNAPVEQDIVVTGSRLATTTFQTPTPVTTVSPEQIRARAPVSLVEVLQDIPTVRPNLNNQNSTNIGSATFDMRSLGSIRTLTMIDGRRVVDSNPSVSPLFDINLIPTALIRNIEIVTAGASSVYGSDAITGVVNILMDSKMTGVRIDGQIGLSQRGDNFNAAINGAYGREFADGRGHIVVAASYFDRPNILYQGSRAWGRTGYTFLTNPGYTATNGQFRQLILPGATLSRVTDGGLILSATGTNGAAVNNWAFRNVQFGAAGVQSPFQLGSYVGGVWMQGGGGLFTQPDYGIITPSNRRASGFARTTFDVAPSVEAFAEVLYARTNGHWTNTENYDSGAVIIRQDNAYLPANIRASMVANNIASFTLGRTNAELGKVNNYSKNSYLRPVIGLKGKLDDRWNFDLSAVYTRLTYSARVTNNRNDPLWRLSYDAVVGPNGTPVCRSTLTAPTNGCVPVNLFGENTITQQAIQYFGGTSHNDTTGHGLDVQGNFGGRLFEGWAGPVSASIGAEYRREDLNLKTDPVSATNSWRQAGSGPYSGKINVKELYGEASIPLLKDVPLVKYAELSLAARAVKYSTSGSARVWKIGGSWTVNDSIRFRGTYSKDFRAPKLSELFAAPFESQGSTVVDPTNNQTVGIRTVTGGNSSLRPEVAKTKTFGLILQPTFVPRLRFSVDYFNIKLNNAISQISGQEVVDRCAAGAQDFCAGITRDAVGAIFRVNTVPYNATYLRTNGLDFATSYDLPLDQVGIGFGGTVHLSVNATYTKHIETLANGVLIDRAGQVGIANTSIAAPHWRGAGRLAYDRGPVVVSLLGNLVGGGKYDTTYGPLDLNRNDYPAYFYLALNAAYDVTKSVNVFVKVDNLFDTDPPYLSSSTIIRALAAGPSGFYDQFGRSFTIGARVKW